MKILNPATEEILADVPGDDKVSLQNKFEKLKSGQVAWSRTSLSERTDLVNRFADLLRDNADSLAKTLTGEVGKPIRQSHNEINGAIARIKWLTDNAVKYLGDETMTFEAGLEEMISYEALGIICNISAWNYPYLVGINVIVPALLAGNSVMYKPSEYATLTGQAIAGLLQQAGIPENVFQVATGGKETGEILLQMSFDGYFFTGSYKTGKHIYETVAGKMVPCQCELGGKDPLYVADDIQDIQSVAAATADGAFYNNGQSCCAVERIYVHENVYDKYLEAFQNEVASWKIGDPNGEVYIGPLAREAQVEVLESQVADALDKGATLVAGGKRIRGKGYYFQPTILTNVNHSMSVMKEESFGPLIGIMKVEDDMEATMLMQDTEYGLTASVYSAHKDRAQNILREINAGTGYWNCCDRVTPALPWSGRKHSGIGSTLSHAGLRAFTKPKAWHLKS